MLCDRVLGNVLCLLGLRLCGGVGVGGKARRPRDKMDKSRHD